MWQSIYFSQKKSFSLYMWVHMHVSSCVHSMPLCLKKVRGSSIHFFSSNTFPCCMALVRLLKGPRCHLIWFENPSYASIEKINKMEKSTYFGATKIIWPSEHFIGKEVKKIKIKKCFWSYKYDSLSSNWIEIVQD